MSGLKRKTPLRQSAIDAEKALRDTPRRKTPLARKRFTGKPTRRAVEHADGMRVLTALAIVRDGPECRLSGATNPTCAGQCCFHHLRFRSQGGLDVLENGVLVCVAHHDWIHSHDQRAAELGLKVPTGDTLEDAWRRMYAHGLATKPEPSPRPARSPYTGTEDDRCDLCLRRGFVGLCPSCETGSALR